VPFETAVAPLQEDLALSPARYPELVEALVAKPTEWSAPLLNLLLQNASSREDRKRVKRALYRLQQKGFVWEERTSHEDSIWKPPPAPKTICHLGMIYDEGARIVIMFVPVGRVKYIFMDAAISDRIGLLNYRNSVFEGPKISKNIDTFFTEEKDFFIKADPGHCRFLLEEARDISLRQGKDLPAIFREDMSHMVRQVPKMDMHPLYRRVDKDQIRLNPQLLDDIIELIEIQGSPLGVIDRSILDPYLEEYTTTSESRIILNKFQQDSRKDDIYRRVVKDIFGRAEERRRTQRRLEEMGYFMWEKGFEDVARFCAAAAMGLEAAQGGEISPSPLLMAIARHSLEYHANRDDKFDKEKHPLIVKPHELDENKLRFVFKGD